MTMPVCLRCGVEFENGIVLDGLRRNLQRRKYCLSCSPFGSGNKRKLHEPKLTCKNCDGPCRNKNQYCSITCQGEYQYRAWVERWLAGNESGCGVDGRTSSRIRRYLISTRGARCEVCGWSERHPATGAVPVTVHHIDGNSDNNRPENLCLLCPNHHSLTPTYGNLNKGSGRRRRHQARGFSSVGRALHSH